MRLSRLAAIISLSALLASCGASGPELTKTASGTWLSDHEQGNRQTVLTTTNAPDGKGLLALTVMDLTTGFLPKGEIMIRPDESKKQIVRIGFKIANVGVSNVAFKYDSLQMHLKNGTPGTISFYVNPSNVSDFLQSADLAPEASIEGAVYYELPDTAVRNDMVLEYHGSDKTTELNLIK